MFARVIEGIMLCLMGVAAHMDANRNIEEQIYVAQYAAANVILFLGVARVLTWSCWYWEAK
jgi:hypothetical protein